MRTEITALFAAALDGDEHAELELGRRWLDEDDPLAGRAAEAVTTVVLAELERDPVYRAWAPRLLAPGTFTRGARCRS